MAPVPPLPRTQDDNRRFIRAYTQGLTTGDFERLFTRDTPEAYRFFSRHIDFTSLAKLLWHRRTVAHARLVFLAFTLKLTPARRAIYGMALVATVFGLFELANGFQLLLLPHPVFEDGTLWLLSGFLLLNLLVLLEVADRLSLKNALEIAREIQQAMMRTLVDEGFDGAKLMARLNVQITKHAPASRFITLVCRHARSGHRRHGLRQCRAEPADAAARQRRVRIAPGRRHGPRDVRPCGLRRRARHAHLR